MNTGRTCVSTRLSASTIKYERKLPVGSWVGSRSAEERGGRF